MPIRSLYDRSKTLRGIPNKQFTISGTGTTRADSDRTSHEFTFPTTYKNCVRDEYCTGM